MYKRQVTKAYDKENKKPVIKASICNGEQVAGFKNIHTGKIEEVMLTITFLFITPSPVSYTHLQRALHSKKYRFEKTGKIQTPKVS